MLLDTPAPVEAGKSFFKPVRSEKPDSGIIVLLCGWAEIVLGRHSEVSYRESQNADPRVL